VITTKIS